MPFKRKAAPDRTEAQASEEKTVQVLRVSSKIGPRITKYYLKVSKRYRILQLFLLITLMVYVFFIISAFGKYITYDNLQYLLRDLDSLTTQGESEFSSIRYDKQSEQDFAVFKNGIAAAGKESITLFDSTGLQLCKDQLSYSDPVLIPSDKYLLLYDMGGNGYSVYNSITRVVNRKMEHKIVDGDMSDSGAFLLVTRYSESKYAVWVYNSALTQTMRIRKENYVMDAAISKDGKRIAVCSAVPSATDLDCEIALYKAGDNQFSQTVTIPGAMPLSVHFTENGFAVLCDNGLYFYDMEGKEVSSALISGVSLEYADLSDRYMVLAGSENALGTEYRIMILDADGTLLAEDILKERVMGIASPSEEDDTTLAYVLTAESVLRLTPNDTQSSSEEENSVFAREEEPLGDSDVLALRAADKGVIVFTATDAYYLFN